MPSIKRIIDYHSCLAVSSWEVWNVSNFSFSEKLSMTEIKSNLVHYIQKFQQSNLRSLQLNTARHFNRNQGERMKKTQWILRTNFQFYWWGGYSRRIFSVTQGKEGSLMRSKHSLQSIQNSTQWGHTGGMGWEGYTRSTLCPRGEPLNS